MKQQKYKVLYVDDDITQTSIAKRTLKMDHFEFLSANSAREGMKLLRQEDVDFIITDYIMPEVDGLRFINKVKSMPQFKDIPIVIISEDEQIHDMVGPDKVICTFKKPFNPEEVKKVIKNSLNISSNGIDAKSGRTLQSAI